jgi:hypothetical protein
VVNEMTFEVGLPVAAVEDLIRSRIDAPTLASGLITGAVHGRRYVGRVAGARFEVWIRRRSYNSVAPQLTGTIESTPGGSRVIASIGPPQVTRWTLAALAGFGAVGVVPVLLGVGYGLAVALLLVAPLVIIVVLLLRGCSVRDPGFPRSEAEELRMFLGEALAPEIRLTWASSSSISERLIA